MTHSIDQAIFDIARVLEVPVLILALLALAAVIVEVGSFAVELRARTRRHFPSLAASARAARLSLEAGRRTGVAMDLDGLAWSGPMYDTIDVIATHAGTPGADTRIAKALADFDFDAQRRLGRTRLLVRTGPALGLMGTLIPLSPALDGLANGKIDELSQNLRVAFSVTVLGLLVGAIAFALSLYRDRIYGQDLSDLTYIAAVMTDPEVASDEAMTPPHPAPASTSPVTVLPPPLTVLARTESPADS